MKVYSLVHFSKTVHINERCRQLNKPFLTVITIFRYIFKSRLSKVQGRVFFLIVGIW